jgi:hypothetical protein
LHVPAEQEPHEPPHPSEPHDFPVQLGVQLHLPAAVHVPFAQVPHDPPHPSGPHVRPAQLGTHASLSLPASGLPLEPLEPLDPFEPSDPLEPLEPSPEPLEPSLDPLLPFFVPPVEAPSSTPSSSAGSGACSGAPLVPLVLPTPVGPLVELHAAADKATAVAAERKENRRIERILRPDAAKASVESALRWAFGVRRRGIDAAVGRGPGARIAAVGLVALHLDGNARRGVDLRTAPDGNGRKPGKATSPHAQCSYRWGGRVNQLLQRCL